MAAVERDGSILTLLRSLRYYLPEILAYNSFGVNILASFILMLLSLHQLWKCASKRLWLFPCYPARFIALNAGTLALLGIATKAPKLFVPDDVEGLISPVYFTVMGCILACAFIGACMPSIASTDRSQMWSNFAGTALLLMSITYNILFYTFYPPSQLDGPMVDQYSDSGGLLIYHTIQLQAACLIIFILVLTMQAFAMDEMISDVKASISMRLQQLKTNTIPVGAEKQVITWSWEALEHTTCIKLMMALTSNLQNVASRSPSSAILAPLILLQIGMSGQIIQLLNTPFRKPRRIVRIILFGVICVSIIPVGFICVSRWLRLAICDDRPLRSLLFDTPPFYWRRKVTNLLLHLKAGPSWPLHPTIWQHITYTLKSMVYCILAFFMLFIVFLYWLLLTFMKSIHTLSTLLQVLKPLLLALIFLFMHVKSLVLHIYSELVRCFIKEKVSSHVAPPDVDLSPGVVYIPGEDPLIVQKLYEKSARHVIGRCIKKAETKPMEALETILKLSNQACYFRKNVIYEVLDQKGTPDVTMFHVGKYGDQYGWSLTVVSLLEVMSKAEVGVFGTFKTTMAAMEAYKQALPMVTAVDEMHAPIVCSGETYLKASTSLWLSLINKSRSWQKAARHVQVMDPVHVLDMHLETARMQLQKQGHVFPWTMEAVKAYTMYTVCQNLQRWCVDVEIAARGAATNDQGTCLVEHIHYLIAEVLAGCLCGLPAVLERRMNTAVCIGNVGEIETGIYLIHQAQKMWKKLQWPQHSVALPDVSADGFPLSQYWLQQKQATNDAAVSRKDSRIGRGYSWPRAGPQY